MYVVTARGTRGGQLSASVVGEIPFPARVDAASGVYAPVSSPESRTELIFAVTCCSPLPSVGDVEGLLFPNSQADSVNQKRRHY